MFRFLLPLVLAATPALATPFVVYSSPGSRCDVIPVSQACRNAERAEWRQFLGDKLAQYYPRVTHVRLADLFDKDRVYYGWTFRIIVPSAPAQKVAITVGGVPLTRSFEQYGSLVIESTIERSQLAPGTHKVVAKAGSREVFSFDVILDDSSAPPPLDPKQLAAETVAAAAKPPFLVANLPTQPTCSEYPRSAGCTQSQTRSWNALSANQTARFVRKGRVDAGGEPILHWQVYLVFPKPPAMGWLDRDLEIQVDRNVAKYARRNLGRGTDAVVVELILLESDHAAGKHEIRAIDRVGTVIFTGQVELIK